MDYAEDMDVDHGQPFERNGKWIVRVVVGQWDDDLEDEEEADEESALVDAYEVGAEACLAGKSKRENPHDDRNLRDEWDEGWDDASEGRYPMKTFDVTLSGFDGSGSPENDALVKWVKAPNREVLDKFLADKGLGKYIESVDYLENRDDLTVADGVDLRVNAEGKPSNNSWQRWSEEAL
jgi:ribosome modulation factor